MIIIYEEVYHTFSVLVARGTKIGLKLGGGFYW